MALGDKTIVTAHTQASYRAQDANLIGEIFDSRLQLAAQTTNILEHLQGAPGSGKPFVVKQDLAKGANETVHFNSSSRLGQAGRRGTQTAVNFEEEPRHSTWPVKIDTLRVVVGWNEINKAKATTGKSWQSLYPELCGQRVGEIEREDMLLKFRQRSSSRNTIRPGNRSSLNALRFDDTFDTATLGKGIAMGGSLGMTPASIGKSRSGMAINKFVALGSEWMMQPLYQDQVFLNALQHAEVDGKENPFWTGDIPNWKGTAIKSWTLVDEDHPGAIGSSIEPKAILGDPITAGTTAITIYGGGRTQAALGDSKVLYKPFDYFYGNEHLFGESFTSGADATTYYFIVVDPADGKWCMYSYVGTNSNGNSITITGRLAASASGIAVTTLGEVEWNSAVNKVGTFPTGSLIYQVNAAAVPVGDIYVFGADAGAKCYGEFRNKRIRNEDDYGALQGVGVQSIYGCDMRTDTNGLYRGFLRIQAAYELPGVDLPQVA